MLSHDIRSLREKFAACRHGGVTLPSDQVEHIVACLKDCERQASALERSMAPANGQLTADHLLSGKVALFPVAARPRPFLRVVKGRDNGGDAA